MTVWTLQIFVIYDKLQMTVFLALTERNGNEIWVLAIENKLNFAGRPVNRNPPKYLRVFHFNEAEENGPGKMPVNQRMSETRIHAIEFFKRA